MPEPHLTAGQRSRLEKFASSLEARGLSADVQTFLVTLRRHKMVARATQAGLAHRAAALEGEPPPGRAKVGHDLEGNFNARRLTDELNGRDRLPRRVLVQAIAEAYAARRAVQVIPVLAELERLRSAAEHAAAKDKERREDEALAAGRRFATNADVRSARGERDAARERLAEVEEELAELQERFDSLGAEIDEGHAREVHSLQQEVGELRGKIATLEGELEDSRAQAVSLLAEVDQLTAGIEDLERRLSPHSQLLVPGVPDLAVRRAIAAMGDGVTADEARRKCSDLPTAAWLHIAALGLDYGILLSDRRTSWKTGTSSVPNAGLLHFVHALFAIGSISYCVSHAADSRWFPPIGLLWIGIAVLSVPRVRRTVSGGTLALLMIGGIGYSASQGLEATSLDIIVAAAYSILGLLGCIGAWMSATEERCLDEIATHQTADSRDPSEALRIEMEDAARAVRTRQPSA